MAVVGAGPAGAVAALAAARLGARVLLLDRHDFPRDKPCGDGIAPQALDVLDALDITGVTDGYPPIPVLRLDAPAPGASVERVMARPAHVIPRYVFDARLVAAATAAGVTLRRHTVRRVEPLADRVLVDDFEARVVIGADGASSLVRRAIGAAPNPPGHLAIAIRGYAPADSLMRQHIVMADEYWPAYAWSFPIGDGRRNVGYGEMIQGSPTTRAHLLARLTALLPDVADATDLRAHHLPLSTHRPIPGKGRILLAGDALSLINPFTGEGIFYAVLSGSLAGATAATFRETPASAADVLAPAAGASMAGAGEAGGSVGGVSGLDDPTARGGLRAAASPAELYAAALRRRLGRHLRHTGLAARLAQRQWIVRAGISAADKHQAVFDSFVELGLGDGLLTARMLARIAREAL